VFPPNELDWFELLAYIIPGMPVDAPLRGAVRDTDALPLADMVPEDTIVTPLPVTIALPLNEIFPLMI
jgi:hypothetical protein